MDSPSPKNIYEKLFGYSLIAIVVLVIILNRSCNKINEKQETINTYQAADDSLHKTINNQREEVTQTKLMLSDYNTIKFQLQSKDSTVKKLQSIIDSHTITATVLNTQTRDNGTTATVTTRNIIVTRHDTVFVYPTYETKWSERWSSGKITANKDSISRSVTMLNEYDIKQSYQRTGTGIQKYFKQRTPMVEVTNINPYTTTTALKSFSLAPDKKPKKKAFVIGVIIGAGIFYGLTHLK